VRKGGAKELMIPKLLSNGINPMCQFTKFTNKKTLLPSQFLQKSPITQGQNLEVNGHLDM
jgi:hypothetical protein